MKKKKSRNTPFFLKAIQWWYPKWEKLFPTQAHHWAYKRFFTPFKIPFSQNEKATSERALSKKMLALENGQKVCAYKFGNPNGTKKILLIHGWSGKGMQFHVFIKLLEEASYDITVFDMPAHGASEGKMVTILGMAEAMRKVFDHYGPFDFWVGHSLGCGAAIYNLKQNYGCSKMALISPPVLVEPILRRFESKINASEKTGAFIKDQVKKNYGNDFESYTIEGLMNVVPEIPAIIISDEEDEETPPEHTDFLLEKWPNAKLVRTLTLGHTRILKEEFVARKCLEFFES